MNQHRSQKSGKFLRTSSSFAQAAGSALLLTSCAVSSPLTVQSVRADAAAQNIQIAISPADRGDQTLKARFAGALMGSLSDRGIPLSQSGDLVADYAASASPADVGIMSSDGAQDTPVWIARPRPAKRFDKCEAMVMRGSLLLLDRNTGAAVYRGTGTMTDCSFDDGALRAMADGLVADYIAAR